ncbi:MAG: hypothetical protein ACOX8B_06040 [Lachnospiraceae bacterium]|jgi:cytoskeletal protein RodZ
MDRNESKNLNTDEDEDFSEFRNPDEPAGEDEEGGEFASEEEDGGKFTPEDELAQDEPDDGYGEDAGYDVDTGDSVDAGYGGGAGDNEDTGDIVDAGYGESAGDEDVEFENHRRSPRRQFLRQDEYRSGFDERKTDRRKRKKKGNGLVRLLTVLLIITLILLAVCVIGLVYVQHGGKISFSVPSSFSRDSGSSATVAAQAAEEQNPAETAAASVSGTSAAEDADAAGQTDAAQNTEDSGEAAAASLEGQEDTGETGSAGEALASLTSAFSNDGLTAAETEEQTYSTDASGNLVIPEREAGSFEMEPEWTNTLVSTGDETLDEANRLAAGYDYDSAISLLQSAEGYADNADYQSAVAEYESEKAQCTPYPAMNTITHIFFHSLVVDTSRAFDENIAISKQDGTNKVNAYNEVMTTVDEFCRIISDMYEKGYVLVGLHDIAGMTQNADGTETMQFREILLPPGKTPFVLSVDDVSYYEYMTGHGFASRLVLDANGKVTNEYINPDGSVMYGSYDVLTILEDFIEAHPDFSYRGARGTLALTGYEGILGYRTSDYWYNWDCDYFREENLETRERLYYNNENIEQDKAAAKQVADAIRELGWTFASHSWGHRDMGAISYEEMVWDADMWEKEVQPLVGETDLMIFPKGADIDSWRGYAEDNQKFQYLKQLGFDYFCNVDSSQYWIQIGERGDYFRMGRRDLDGTRMWEAIESYVSPGSATNRLSDLFDVRTVFDWSRPTPVE